MPPNMTVLVVSSNQLALNCSGENAELGVIVHLHHKGFSQKVLRRLRTRAIKLYYFSLPQ